MSERKILVLCEGRHELGEKITWGQPAIPPQLPALPTLVHRLVDEPSRVSYTMGKFGDEARIHSEGIPLSKEDYAGNKYCKDAMGAIVKARTDGYAAVVIVIDRDRRREAKLTILPLRSGRDSAVSYTGLACAIGVAVETFDAWMIADGGAVALAGGDANKSHASPEGLDGVEGTGNHPKDRAAALFGGSQGLGAKYAQVAARVDLQFLEKACPAGFAPFAKEVRERLRPVVGGCQ